MEHLIGLGGYGVVFKGFDTKTARDVSKTDPQGFNHVIPGRSEAYVLCPHQGK